MRSQQNKTTREVEMGGLQFDATLGKNVSRILSQKTICLANMSSNPSITNNNNKE
jgi:hypothetical protein